MKRHLLKITMFATLVFFAFGAVHAQDLAVSGDSMDNDTTHEGDHGYDEVIIKHKHGKDAKVTIEIKGDQVLVNGKPVSDYKDEDLSIVRRKTKTRNGTITYFDGDGMEHELSISPFREGNGVFNFDGGDVLGGERAFLGVSSIKTDKGPEGARVGEVSKGSAAEKGGLKTGDLITKLDETTIDGPESLVNTVHKYKPGEKVTITYLRDGKEQKVTVELGKSDTPATVYGFNTPDARNFDLNGEHFKFDMPRGGGYGYSLGNFHRLGIHAQDTEDGKGVKVLEVDEESAAAKAGVKEGDIITKFAGKEVNSAMTLATLARENREKPTVEVSIIRDGKPMDLVVKTPRKLNTADL
jgi:serine protease Do